MLFDVRHGGGSFDYTVADAAIAQGCPPDTISSDIHVYSGNSAGQPYLSKFLNMGFTLEQVVTMVTANPAKIINRIAKHGTLQVGAPADVTLLDVVNDPVEFVNRRNNKRQGQVFIKPTHTVIAGTAIGQPYQAPFSTRQGVSSSLLYTRRSSKRCRSSGACRCASVASPEVDSGRAHD